MSLTPTDIARIANLARLELAPEESARLLASLNGFFGIVEAMSAVDTRGVEPLAQPTAAVQDVALRLREDVVSETNNREANMRNAPEASEGYFLVPKVIE